MSIYSRKFRIIHSCDPTNLQHTNPLRLGSHLRSQPFVENHNDSCCNQGFQRLVVTHPQVQPVQTTPTRAPRRSVPSTTNVFQLASMRPPQRNATILKREETISVPRRNFYSCGGLRNREPELEFWSSLSQPLHMPMMPNPTTLMDRAFHNTQLQPERAIERQPALNANGECSVQGGIRWTLKSRALCICRGILGFGDFPKS